MTFYPAISRASFASPKPRFSNFGRRLAAGPSRRGGSSPILETNRPAPGSNLVEPARRRGADDAFDPPPPA
jgi:hypothetical protein